MDIVTKIFITNLIVLISALLLDAFILNGKLKEVVPIVLLSAWALSSLVSCPAYLIYLIFR